MGTPVKCAASQELDWLIPSGIVTFALATFGATRGFDRTPVATATDVMAVWMLWGAAAAGVMIFLAVAKMSLRKVDRPLAHCRSYAAANWSSLLLAAAFVALAGVNMLAFCWIKPWLNEASPFWTDPYLARIDRAIFLVDPWRLLAWLNSGPMPWLYHPAWFTLLVLTIVAVCLRPPSKDKSAILLAYFLIWSLFGPVVQYLLPAAGPIFYQRLGYGDEFALLRVSADTREVSDLLWQAYASHNFYPGAGISAMPSLHIAVMAWMVLAVAKLIPGWTKAIAVAGTLIFLLSIALGWHYAIDGIAGALGTFLCWRLAKMLVGVRLPDELRKVRAAPVRG